MDDRLGRWQGITILSSHPGKTMRLPFNCSCNVNCFLLCLSFYLWGAICISCSSKPIPSDTTLIDNYKMNKSSFSELLEIYKLNPSLREVSIEALKSDNPDRLGIRKPDIKKYCKLFEQLGVQILLKWSSREIRIIIYDFHPFPPGGTYKGYAFLNDPPDDQVEDLDLFWNNKKQQETIKTFTVYRPIEGNWYLFFDFED